MKPVGRRTLNHDVPSWVRPNPEGDVFFLTICCQRRGVNQLAIPEVWQAIVDTIENRESRGQWNVRLALAMPDHLHLLASFEGVRMKRAVPAFKSWLAKTRRIEWQRGFFDHRLRTHESAAAKGAYIRANPERAGLIPEGDPWPYCLDRVNR